MKTTKSQEIIKKLKAVEFEEMESDFTVLDRESLEGKLKALFKG